MPHSFLCLDAEVADSVKACLRVFQICLKDKLMTFTFCHSPNLSPGLLYLLISSSWLHHSFQFAQEIEEPMIASWLWGCFDHPMAQWGPEADQFIPVQTLSFSSPPPERLSDLELLCLMGSNQGKTARPGPRMGCRGERGYSLLWCILPHLNIGRVWFISLPKIELCWVLRGGLGISLSSEWNLLVRSCF